MNIKAIFGGVMFTLKKCSPEILLGVGVVGVVGSTVLACAATLKADAIVEEMETKGARIDDCVSLRESSELDYSVTDEKKDRRTLMLWTAGKFVRLYGPSFTLMVFSLFCIISSYGIMKKRNVALMAAYKLLEETFANYRKRVVSEFGEQADSRFYYGEERSTIKTIDEEGNETESETILRNLSGFARSFEEMKPDQYGGWTGATQWSKCHEYNLRFLEGKEQHFNNMLVVKGAVCVNDVYSELGIPTTDSGMICGWRYKSDRGDGYISFRPRGIDGNWDYGKDGDSIVLDFNIDGVIFDQKVARKEMKVR